jgi:elongation of very long chain fatty acids protein 7
MIMDFCEKYGDPRLKDYFLMESPMSTVFMVALYLIIVKMLGPKLMENREEFDLRKTLLIYNLFQVVLSLIIFYRCSTFWLFDYNWRCAPMNRERTPKQFYVINTTYLYFLSKFTEFFDTVFFVMRKKFRQISTLHVFHHSVMPLIAWIGLKVPLDTEHWRFSWIVECTSSCTLIICSLAWDLKFRNTFGGKDTWLKYKLFNFL